MLVDDDNEDEEEEKKRCDWCLLSAAAGLPRRKFRWLAVGLMLELEPMDDEEEEEGEAETREGAVVERRKAVLAVRTVKRVLVVLMEERDSCWADGATGQSLIASLCLTLIVVESEGKRRRCGVLHDLATACMESGGEERIVWRHGGGKP